MEVLEEYGQVRIERKKSDPIPTYSINEPELSKTEKDFVASYRKLVPRKEINEIKELPDVASRWELMKEKLRSSLPKTKNEEYMLSKVVGLVMGYGRIGILMDDDELEEVMVNGIKLPIYVYHRKHGMCRTKLSFDTADDLNDIVYSIAYVNGKEQSPVMDIAAIDGSRVNVTGNPLTSKGPTVTIRKQRRKVFSIIELIEQKTLSLDLAAFLWLAVEGMKLTPANILVAGSIGGGKTTTLNALSSFIPPAERVVTIEDTFELNIDNIENKVQLEAKKDMDMDVLLRDTLRMRPDRIIVGEIRGKEAITLFNAMAIGRVGMGTIHSSSAREVASRLENPPMSISANTIGSLDLILVQNKFLNKGRLVRRVTEVAEVTGAIKDTVMMGKIFEWDPKSDEVLRTSEQDLKTPILFLDKLSKATKLDKGLIVKELKLRRAVLEYMIRKGIDEQKQVTNFITRFYSDLEGLIKETPDLFGEADEKERS